MRSGRRGEQSDVLPERGRVRLSGLQRRPLFVEIRREDVRRPPGTGRLQRSMPRQEPRVENANGRTSGRHTTAALARVRASLNTHGVERVLSTWRCYLNVLTRRHL